MRNFCYLSLFASIICLLGIRDTSIGLYNPLSSSVAAIGYTLLLCWLYILLADAETRVVKPSASEQSIDAETVSILYVFASTQTPPPKQSEAHCYRSGEINK